LLMRGSGVIKRIDGRRRVLKRWMHQS
jgi:hypothetical protein